MVISTIITDEYVYFSLHAEQVITSNYEIDNSDGLAIGLSESHLTISTITKIILNVKDYFYDKSKILLLDFKNIETYQANINSKFAELKEIGFKIIFINISSLLVSNIGFKAIINKGNILNEDTNIYKMYHFFEENITLAKSPNPKDLFEEEFFKRIKLYISSYEKYNNPHTSSFVYLGSYIDLKRFMSFEKEFSLFAIYLLAQKIKSTWKKELDREPILVCLSMNSSYLVSILSTFLRLNTVIFDKIGPVNKLYSRLDKSINHEKQYIVVSDLVCLGTEVKIVKNIIHFIGGKYLGNVSLIKTETLKPKDIKKEDATIAVFSINRCNNKQLKYNIYTDLEDVE